MRLSNTIRHYLKYPLMWVMLLWALTLPGHELAVYSFLVKGSISEVAPSLFAAPDGEGATSARQQTVQVFLDANTAPAIVLSPQQAIRCFLQLFSFAPPADDDLPTFAQPASGAEQLAQLFPITIQPNAP